MGLVLGCLLVFLTISCDGPSLDREVSTTSIRFPIEEFAVASERTVWIITDRSELVRISDKDAEVVPFPGKPQTLFFLSDREGWAYDVESNLWATTDGGGNWSLRSSLKELGPTIKEIRFIDAESGWLINWSSILTTSDGGATWTMVYPTDDLNYGTLGAQPTSISVVNDASAWVGMTNGVVLNTNDRGGTWRRFIPIPEKSDVRAIHANAKGEVWVGIVGNSSGLYYTTKSGEEWSEVLYEGGNGKLCGISVSFGAPKDGWVFGSGCAQHPYDTDPIQGIVFKTTNGRKWTQLEGDTFRIPFDEVRFTDTLNGWLFGYNHQERHSYIHRTTDGGENWYLVYDLRRPREEH